MRPVATIPKKTLRNFPATLMTQLSGNYSTNKIDLGACVVEVLMPGDWRTSAEVDASV